MAADEIHEIKSRLDIVEIVAEYVKLKKNGQTFWGCCPFHNEKTPSFSVSPQRQSFHCFGCGKGGDIFTFIMEMEHLEFKEALEKLAERAGVTLTRRAERPQTAALDIGAAALEYFQTSLTGAGGEAARSYLERRKLTPEECARFEIGWSPTSWDGLVRALQRKGFTGPQLAESGLASPGRDGGYFDRFRGRVIFPIRAITGRLVGFGGRILDGEGAKYLNSPESRLFNKRHNLYLLDKAKTAMNAKGCAILVEGYMDAIRAHLFGYTNAAASLGTALTNEQASLIKRMTGLCYVCYDSDSAGQEAALKAMYILHAEGVTAKRVLWQGGKDPDEILLLPNGVELFENAIKNALPLPLFHAQLRREALKDPLRAPEARRDLFDGLSTLSVFDVMPYMDELSAALSVFPHEMQRMIEEQRKSGGGERVLERPRYFTNDEEPNAQSEPVQFGDDLEYMLCSLLWGRGELRSEYDAEEIMRYIKDPGVQNIVFALLGGEEPSDMERRWQQMGDRTGLQIIARGDGLLSKEGIIDETASKLIETMRQNFLKRKISSYVKKIKVGAISEEEYSDYLKYNRLLKGGNIKA
ncbi:MAG: DNA primase [Cloacibacillus sp.]